MSSDTAQETQTQSQHSGYDLDTRSTCDNMSEACSSLKRFRSWFWRA